MGAKSWQLRTIPFLVEGKPLRRKSGSHLKFITSPKQAFQFVFHSMYTKPSMSGSGKHSCLEPVFPPLQPLHLPEKPELSIYTCRDLNIFTNLSTLIYNATLLGIDFSIHNLPSTINCLLSTAHLQYHKHIKNTTASESIVLPPMLVPHHQSIQKASQQNRCPHTFRWGQQLGN